MLIIWRVCNWWILFCFPNVRREQARIMQTLGQTLDIELFDKDDTKDDENLGR